MPPQDLASQIEQAMMDSEIPTRDFNVLIESLIEGVEQGGMRRERVLQLLLNQVSASAGGGRHAALDSADAMAFKGVQDAAQASKAVVESIDRR